MIKAVFYSFPLGQDFSLRKRSADERTRLTIYACISRGELVSGCSFSIRDEESERRRVARRIAGYGTSRYNVRRKRNRRTIARTRSQSERAYNGRKGLGWAERGDRMTTVIHREKILLPRSEYRVLYLRCSFTRCRCINDAFTHRDSIKG